MKGIENHPKPKLDTLLQPNKVTEMRRAATELEENLFTLIIEALQKHMSKEKLIDTSLWGDPVFNIDLKEVDPTNKPSKVFARVRSMQDQKFHYETTSKNGKPMNVYGVVFPTIFQQDNHVQIHINVHALPFLLEIGKGATYYKKSTALTLSGSHTKRIYKLLCSWKNKGGWRVKIEDFKAMLGINDKYKTNAMLKRDVLVPAKEEMYNNQNSDIWFEYSTETSEELKQQGGRGRRAHDQLVFKIHTRYKSNNEQLEELRKGVSFEHFNEIYKFLQHCIGKTNYKAQEIVGACTDEGDRFCNQRYKDLKGLREKSKSTPQSFNFFMSAAQKHSGNDIFKLRYKDCKSKSNKTTK